MEEFEKSFSRDNLLNDSLQVDAYDPSAGFQVRSDAETAITKISCQLRSIERLIRRGKGGRFSTLESYTNSSRETESILSDIKQYITCRFDKKYPGSMKDRIDKFLGFFDTLVSDIHKGLSDEAALAKQPTNSPMAFPSASAVGARFGFASSSQADQNPDTIIDSLIAAHSQAIAHLEELKTLGKQGALDLKMVKGFQEQLESLKEQNQLRSAYIDGVKAAMRFFSPKS